MVTSERFGLQVPVLLEVIGVMKKALKKPFKPTADGQGPFLHDLGFMKDGELYIVGRLKDMIIIRA